MMSAREMFEKLGYTQICNNCNYIMYETMNEFCHIKYTFYVMNESFEKTAYVADNQPQVALIFMDELSAINKQVEELGWNNE